MHENWQNWCRLCAKEGLTNQDSICKMESVKEQLEIVEKCFAISIIPFEGIQLMICSECSMFLRNVESFKDRCMKVDQMFNNLVLNRNISSKDILSIRFKLTNDNEEKFSSQLSHEVKEDEIKDDISPAHSPDPLTMDYMNHSEVEQEEPAESSEPNRPVPKKRRRRKPPKLTMQKKPKKQKKLQENQENKEQHPTTEDQKKSGRKAADRECKICMRKFTRLMGLRNHMIARHRRNEMPFGCPKCPKRFVTKASMKMHEVSHLPDEERLIHSCMHCNKKFSKQSNLKLHITSQHTKDSVHICEECGKSFNTKGGLHEHRVVHTDEHPFPCSFCPKKFKNLPSKKRHEEIHADIKHECNFCGIKLKTRRTLRLHMLVHSDKKNYKCNYCGNEYKRAKTLKDHLILHTGQRPFECPFCDKTFANNSNCRSHKKKDHPIELAAWEASGQKQRIKNLPKLVDLQSKVAVHHLKAVDKK